MTDWIKIALFLLGGFSYLLTPAQEIHLSQYDHAKMLNNPSQTGNMNPDFRISLHQRSQWKTISNPYILSVFTLEIKKKTSAIGKLGAGFYFVKNQAGKSQLQNQVYAGSISYQIKISQKNDIATGMYVGYRQRTINLDGLSWDAQHNGVTYDPALPTGENFDATKQNSIDFGIGALWKHHSKVRYDIGYTAAHYFQNQGFLVTNTDKLLLKQMINYTHYFTYNQFDIEALGRIIQQGGSFEVILGATANYQYGRDSRYTNNLTSSFLSFGIIYRYQDAIVPMFGYNYKRKFAGYLSYDLNVSKLHTASNYRGAWELNLQFTGLFQDKRKKMRELE